jgi:predicted Rossmann fold flavoprotein
VPLTSTDRWLADLRGVTIPDVRVAITPSELGRLGPGEQLASRRGSFLFTHFGLSGPVVMDLSRVVTARPQAGAWHAVCDFAPDLRDNQLAERLAAEAASAGKRTVANMIADIVPRRLADALLRRAGVSPDRRLAELSRGERIAVIAALKSTAIPISGSLGFKKAEVTAGGITLDEVDSRTMQSKVIPGLFIAGEILDVDGPIGGYNFQAAFSTGWLAGESV